LLKQAILGNPNIASVKEIDAAITVFTSMIKSARTTSKGYHTCAHQDSTIPDLEELLRRKSKARKITHNFNREADRRQYSFLKKLYTPTFETQQDSGIWEIIEDKVQEGRDIAQAVSRRFPTAAVRVRAQVR
jgi:hypothetical protein